MIYYCLLELARVKAYGLIQDVYLFGTPIVIKQKECLRAQSAIAGRFVNGYKRNDWILGYLFRATSTGLGRVAGLRPIENCLNIENLDCTELVGGHLMYRDSIPKLMKEAGFLVVSEEFGEMEDPDPDRHRERQIALYDEIEEAKSLVAQEEEEAIKAGKKVKRRTRKSGFLGLWGKEIESKPAKFEAALKSSSPTRPSQNAGSYDPYIVEKFHGVSKEKERAAAKTTTSEDETVLFDVDKMRDELAASGVTITGLESTLPPLVLSPISATRTSTPPVVSPPPITLLCNVLQQSTLSRRFNEQIPHPCQL